MRGLDKAEPVAPAWNGIAWRDACPSSCVFRYWLQHRIPAEEGRANNRPGAGNNHAGYGSGPGHERDNRNAVIPGMQPCGAEDGRFHPGPRLAGPDRKT